MITYVRQQWNAPISEGLKSQLFHTYKNYRAAYALNSGRKRASASDSWSVMEQCKKSYDKRNVEKCMTFCTFTYDVTLENWIVKTTSRLLSAVSIPRSEEAE